MASCTLWHLKDVDFFKRMSEEDMREVGRGAVECELRRGEVLYHPGAPGDSVYVIRRGMIKISVFNAGRELILAMLRKGEIFGQEALLGSAPRDHAAEAHEDAVLCAVSRGEFVALLRRRPDLAFDVTRRVGQRLQALRVRVERLIFKGTTARLAQTLLELAHEHGQADEEGLTLELRLSQSDLAKLVGATRESVNAALAVLRRRRLVSVDAGRLRVLDIDGLAAMR